MDCASSNACILLLLLFYRLVVTAENEQSLAKNSVPHDGVWINKGSMYSRCLSPQFKRLHCSNFSLIQRPVEKSRILRPDCTFLMHRLACSLYKLNCPSPPESSFQMYDIPCQSSCRITVDICNMQVPSTQQISSYWQAYPKHPEALYYPSTPSVTAYRHRPTPGATHSSWQPQQRATPASQSVWPWRPYVPSASQQRVPRASSKVVGRGSNGGVWQLHHKDCRFLPSGGCDDWARKLIKHHHYYTRDYASETRQNPGCPSSFELNCEKMFPRHFTKSDWQRGNFTVAVVMRISQTFWWFGKFNRFKPFFRFNIQKTLKSDIVAYNDKIILTNAWPNACACPNKLVVSKKYLLLTHSRVSRQTLQLSKDSVFLDNPKRYTKLILCWMGTCPHQGAKDRRYRSSYWNWRWKNFRRR